MWQYVGIFLSTAGLLFLEVFSVRIIDVAVSGSVLYYIVSIAMFGIGTAGTLGALMKPIPDISHAAGRVSWFALAASGAVLLLFLGLSTFTNVSSQVLEGVVSEEPATVEGIIPINYLAAYKQLTLTGVIIVGTLMFIPYFCIGLTLSILFRRSRQEIYP